jgi:hypothetical protein
MNKGKNIADLCYAIKDIGRIIPRKPLEPTAAEIIQEARDYIKRNLIGMPLNGCKLRLMDIDSILEGDENE